MASYGPSQPYMNTGYAGTPSSGLTYKGEFDEEAYRKYLEYFRKYGLGNDPAYGPRNKQVLYTTGSQGAGGAFGSSFGTPGGGSAVSPYAIPGADNKAAYMKAYEQARQEALQADLSRANKIANANGMPLSEGYINEVLGKMLKPSDYNPAARGVSQANPTAQLKQDVTRAKALDDVQTEGQLKRDAARAAQRSSLEAQKAEQRMLAEKAKRDAKTDEQRANADAVIRLLQEATTDEAIVAAVKYSMDNADKLGAAGISATGTKVGEATASADANKEAAKLKARQEADAARQAAIDRRAEATRRWQAAMRTAGSETARRVATEKELTEALNERNRIKAYIDSLPESDVRKTEYQAALAAAQASVDFFQEKMMSGDEGAYDQRTQEVIDAYRASNPSATDEEIIADAKARGYL